MPAYIALLRAVNVGGTGKLPMTDLTAMCEKLGFTKVRTYIASGNVVFQTSKSEKAIKAALEAALAKYAGKPVGVMVRTAPELRKLLAENPFSGKAPNRVVACFLDAKPPANTLQSITGKADEEVHLGRREIFVHYGEGMAKSKLKIPAAAKGTARNINTITKLAEMAESL